MFEHPEQKSSLESRLRRLLVLMQDGETPVTADSPSHGSFHPDNQIPFKFVTPEFKPFSNTKTGQAAY